MPVWLSGHQGAWLVRLHVQPGASRSAVVGIHGDSLKIAVKAPPVEGQANAALLRLFSQRLNLPRASLSIVRGANARRKHLLIDATVDQVLLESLPD